MLARGMSRSGHWPDGPDLGEARPAWGAVPECNTGTRQLLEKGQELTHPNIVPATAAGPPAWPRRQCWLPQQVRPLGGSAAGMGRHRRSRPFPHGNTMMPTVKPG